MQDLYSLKENIFSGAVLDVLDNCRRGVPTSVFGVQNSAKNHIVSLLQNKTVYVVKDFIEGERSVKEIEGFSNKKAVFIYEKEELLLTSKAYSKDSEYKRIKAINDFKNGKVNVAVVTVAGLMQLYPKKLNTFTFKLNEDYDLLKTDEILVEMGLTKLDLIEGKGSFSRRGDILDIFPIDGENPIRFDFFGDSLERIKVYDAETGKTVSTLDEVEILPTTEIYLDGVEEILDKISKERAIFSGKNNVRIAEFTEEIKTAVELKTFSELQALTPILKNSATFFDAFGFDNLVFSEPKQLYDLANSIEKEHNERFKNLYSSGEVFSFGINQLLPVELLKDKVKEKNLLSLASLVSENGFFMPIKLVNIRAISAPKFMGRINELANEIFTRLRSNYTVFVSVSKENYDRVSLILAEMGLDNGVKNFNIFTGNVLSGVIYQDEKIAVIGNNDVIQEKEKKLTAKNKNKIFFSAPEAGDYAVHETYGIGKVIGIKRLDMSFGKKDYIAVAYRGGDVLYVPVEQLDSLTKYVGAEKEPTLSKIGGKDFERIKEKVRQSLKELTINLKKLYQERSKKVGYVFEEDKETQTLFNTACGFEDTPDQITATLDIEKDMTSSKVMDRLVCGDVGFGKTEVAFRAIFRAVNNGKQAVLLAPTTILAEQHFNNAKERFKDFGVKIESLDRFKSKKEQEKVLQRLKKGEIDFIVGTHRLLSNDVEFCDLGLLVLDEEQRFGVEHKEKIKTLKSNVDSLTLTATPIPRTLHMSLTGIRDISTINTPPKERLPIQTYVTEETESLLKDAINREIARGGQVFVLYNRVESIYTFEAKLKELLPNIRITVCHGQMEERELERGITEFYNGESDVLLATTIIENGLDLPKANTIIVIDADRLGLSTLYQLRGRVGRSNRLAHAYFTFKKNKALSDTAYQRLSAIMEFTEMGSGFKIAMRDLEIRGAGNILGAEQHGHMDKIGYELYSKLLKEEMEGIEGDTPIDTDIKIPAYIPENYIESPTGRMDAYKEIAEIETKEEAKRIYDNIVFTYGKAPTPIKSLIYVALIKAILKKIGAISLLVGDFGAAFGYENLKKAQDPALFKAMSKNKDVMLSAVSGVSVKFNRNGRGDVELLKEFYAFLVGYEKMRK